MIMNATFSLGGLAVFLLVSVFFTLKNLAEELALRTDIGVEQSSFLFHLYHYLTYIGLLALFIFSPVSITAAGWNALIAIGLLVVNYLLIDIVIWKVWLFLIFWFDSLANPYGKVTAKLLGIPDDNLEDWSEYYCDKYKNREPCDNGFY